MKQITTQAVNKKANAKIQRLSGLFLSAGLASSLLQELMTNKLNLNHHLLMTVVLLLLVYVQIEGNRKNCFQDKTVFFFQIVNAVFGCTILFCVLIKILLVLI